MELLIGVAVAFGFFSTSAVIALAWLVWNRSY